MLEWMILPLKRYADFSGRSRRREYWSFVLLTMIVIAVLFGLMLAGGFQLAELRNARMSGAAAPATMPEFGGMFFAGAGLLGIFALAIFIPSIAVVVRRFHDRDMSGWWYLGLIVAQMIPFVGFIASVAVLVFMLLPGTPGPNRYGPDPKDPTSAGVFS